MLRRGLALWTAGLEQQGDELTFDVDSTDVLPDVVRFLVDAGADIFQVSPQPTSLEDVFVRIVGEDKAL
ncbi:MAG: DUF4162 domain-containing protein [Gemmatimonadaceae bacterium]